MGYMQDAEAAFRELLEAHGVDGEAAEGLTKHYKENLLRSYKNGLRTTPRTSLAKKSV